MRIPKFIFAPLQRWALGVMQRRDADLYIGGRDNPYLVRWWVLPRNRFFNIYLHRIVRDDDDRALHDHPWLNCSILLAGTYDEHTIDAGGIHRRQRRSAGAIKFRRARSAHRLELVGAEAITLFITGPRLRSWGFHCPEAGWVHWQDFTEGDQGELVGRGCGEGPIHHVSSGAAR